MRNFFTRRESNILFNTNRRRKNIALTLERITNNLVFLPRRR